MGQYDVVSADSHVFEPHDLWERYIDPAFRSRAPKIVRQGGQDLLVIDGFDAEFVGIMGTAGVESDRLKEVRVHEEQRVGGWDPHARVNDMDRDGVDAEVLYTSLGMKLHGIRELDYQLACFRAYNDWMADLCSAYPEKLIGIGLISLLDIEQGILELRRTTDRGLGGAAISIDLMAGQAPFWDAAFDPFWATAQEMDVPLSLHLGTAGGRPDRRSDSPGDFIGRYATLPNQMQLSLANLIAYGVFERFPGLKVVSVENDIGWVPTYLARLDHACERYPHWTGARLPKRPSEYFGQVYMTFISDKPGVEMRHHIGLDNIMWSSDYPHPDSTWPESQKVIEWQMEGVPDDDRRKIVCDNAVRLYHLV